MPMVDDVNDADDYIGTLEKEEEEMDNSNTQMCEDQLISLRRQGQGQQCG